MRPCQLSPRCRQRSIASKNSASCCPLRSTSRTRRPITSAGCEPGELDEGRVDISAAAAGIGDLDLVAHLFDRHRQQGQLLLAPAPLGDVGGEEHATAVGHPTLTDAHPSTVDDLVLAFVLAPARAARAAASTIVLAHVGVVDRPQRQPLPEPIVEAHAEAQHLTQIVREVLRVAAVEEDEAILGIENREPVRDALRSGEEARLGLAPVGDVRGQQHAAAVGHPRLADSHPAAVDMLVLALGQGLVARCEPPLPHSPAPCPDGRRGHAPALRGSSPRSGFRVPGTSRRAGGRSSGCRLL